MKRRILAMLLCLVMCLTLVACNSGDGENDGGKKENEDAQADVNVDGGKETEKLKIQKGKNIVAGYDYSVAIKEDGTLAFTGNRDRFMYETINGMRDIGEWKNVVAIAGGDYHIVALSSEGYTYSSYISLHNYGQGNIPPSKDYVAISAGSLHTVLLKSDGTVVAVGDNSLGQCNVSEWKDIVAIDCGGMFTVGLKSDGTVVAAGSNGLMFVGGSEGYAETEFKPCNVDGWTDIVAISAGNFHTVGLKKDGTVVATPSPANAYQCRVDGWKDIVEISAGAEHTVALKKDGTAVYACDRAGAGDARFAVDKWSDIVSISAGGRHTLGLKSDGTVVATGYNGNSQIKVNGWSNIKTSK